MPTYRVKVKAGYEVEPGVPQYYLLSVWAESPEAAEGGLDLPSGDTVDSVEIDPDLTLPTPSEAVARKADWWATSLQVIAVVFLVVGGVLLLVAMEGGFAFVGVSLSCAGSACVLLVVRAILLCQAQLVRNTSRHAE